MAVTSQVGTRTGEAQNGRRSVNKGKYLKGLASALLCFTCRTISPGSYASQGKVSLASLLVLAQ